ncbi:hypothetical protein RRG08_066052 [Elysia crispata]|uniref:Uncharacterized protein n=1 Tax=Elysia crispata TaxID=231223 RepID=A0AAE0Y3Q6_9GAST|nr:hypothetical protein RRG08_066052 [Elysia crispata]
MKLITALSKPQPNLQECYIISWEQSEWQGGSLKLTSSAHCCDGSVVEGQLGMILLAMYRALIGAWNKTNRCVPDFSKNLLPRANQCWQITRRSVISQTVEYSPQDFSEKHHRLDKCEVEYLISRPFLRNNVPVIHGNSGGDFIDVTVMVPKIYRMLAVMDLPQDYLAIVDG